MHTDEWGAEDFRITGDPGAAKLKRVMRVA
jgi:hypothetical protein